MSMFTKFKNCLLIFLLLSMTACSDSDRERALQEQLKQIKISAANEQKKIVPASYSLPKPVTFPPNATNTQNQVATTNTSSNPLENYPLKSLKFTGTVERDNQISAYITTPDDMIYPVTVGDTLGKEYGKVVKIEQTSMDVSVRVATPGKPTTNQIVSLQIKE